MPSLNRKRSLRAWLEQSPTDAVGLVQSDIVESSDVLHARKTANFDLILHAHRLRGTVLAAKFKGRIVDSTGDAIFAVFRSATDAYQYACDLFADPGNPHITVRAGVHFGHAQASLDGGLVGRNVILAARVMAHAGKKKSELWVSDAARSALERESAAFASGIRWVTGEECELEGVPDRHQLWRAA